MKATIWYYMVLYGFLTNSFEIVLTKNQLFIFPFKNGKQVVQLQNYLSSLKLTHELDKGNNIAMFQRNDMISTQ